MELAFESYSATGDPLIILHGLLGSKENWHSMARRLGEHYHTFAVDQRNHGHSPHSRPMSYPAMAEDLQEFISAQRLAPAHFIGHSMGGKTAMQFALAFPRSVRSLVIIDMAPGPSIHRHKKILEAMVSLDLSAFRTRTEIESALAPSVPDLATRRFLLKNVRARSDGKLEWRLGLHEIFADYELLAKPIESSHPYSGPALFLKGDNSDYLTQEDLPGIHRLFPKARLKTVPDSGHLPHVDNPDALYKLLIEFFGALEKPSQD
jgi:esterase